MTGTETVARVQAVLFDVGGVIINNHPDAGRVASILGLSGECPNAADMVDRAMWFHRDAYDAGCTDREFWDAVAGDCGLHELSDGIITRLVHEDCGRMDEADPDALAIIRDLAETGVELGILSNAPACITETIRQAPWARDTFRTYTFSADCGTCKPHRGIYRAALEATGVEAHDILFIDDRRPNLKAAALFGMETLEWDTAEGVRAALVDRGLLKAS